MHEQSAPFTPNGRDIAMLQMAFDYGGVYVDHLRRRFFDTVGGRSPCYRRVSKLIAAHYLIQRRLPATSGIGSGKALLLPGPQARLVLARVRGLSRTELARASRAAAPLFVAHHAAICDTRLAVELAAARSPIFSLVEWVAESELKRSPIRVADPTTGQSLQLIPDAAFTLAVRSGGTQTFWLEQDMGTVAPKRMRAKLVAYFIHAQQHPNRRTPVLFVAPTADRCQAISQWARAEAKAVDADPTIIWLTTRDQLDETTVLSAPIWQVVGVPQPIALAGIAPRGPSPEGAA